MFFCFHGDIVLSQVTTIPLGVAEKKNEQAENIQHFWRYAPLNCGKAVKSRI